MKDKAKEDELISASELARMSSLSRTRIRQLIQRKIRNRPHKRVNDIPEPLQKLKRFFFKKSEAVEWIERRNNTLNSRGKHVYMTRERKSELLEKRRQGKIEREEERELKRTERETERMEHAANLIKWLNSVKKITKQEYRNILRAFEPDKILTVTQYRKLHQLKEKCHAWKMDTESN